MNDLVPVCPVERNHDVLSENDCCACGMAASLYRIATGTTDSGDPAIEARIVLDECVEWTAKRQS